MEKQLEALLIGILSDGFNRSLSALESDGAIDTKKMRKEYKGVGSKYYDLVTRELENTAKLALPELQNLVGKLNNEGKS